MDHTYTIQEVAAKLNLSDKTLRRWEEAGKFAPSRTLGNQRRYSIEDIQILDAIKHGTIASQSELLSIEQAAALCGVSTITIERWENEGKVHPLITSGKTYYPRLRLMAKMPVLTTPNDLITNVSDPNDDILTQDVPELEPIVAQTPPTPRVLPATPKLSSLPPVSPRTSLDSIDYRSLLSSALVTILILISYHFMFNQRSETISPVPGSVQGATTTKENDPRVDDLILKFKEHLSTESMQAKSTKSATTINVAGSSLVSDIATLPAGQNQILVPTEKIIPSTPVTVSFSSDYAPAKKYWVTTTTGSFTLHTDFPVSADSNFSYSYLVQDSTPAPTTPVATPPASSPSATLTNPKITR